MVRQTTNKATVNTLAVASYLATMAANVNSERSARVNILAQLTLACVAAGENIKVGASSIGGEGVDATVIREAIFNRYPKDTAKRIVGSVRYILDKMLSPVRACMVGVDAETQVSAVVKMLADKGIHSQYDLDAKRGRASAQKAKAKAKKAGAVKDDKDATDAPGEGDSVETVASAIKDMSAVLAFIASATAGQCDALASAIASRLATLNPPVTLDNANAA
jgi:hypothetical protein